MLKADLEFAVERYSGRNFTTKLFSTLNLPTKMATWLPAVLLLLVVVVGTVCAENETRVFKMGLLTPWHTGYDFSGYTCASAVSIAIEKVHTDPELNANGRIRLRYTRDNVIPLLEWSTDRQTDTHTHTHTHTRMTDRERHRPTENVISAEWCDE